MFSLKTWTVSSATTRTKTRNSTRGILQLRVQFDYPDEIGTPRSKSNALQLVFKDPAQGFLLTSLLSAYQSRTLDFELEAPANASKFVEDPLPAFSGRTQKKVLGETAPLAREHRSFQNDATQLASNDSKRAHFINIPFSAETFNAQVLDTKSPTNFLDFFAHLRVKSNEALNVDEIS